MKVSKKKFVNSIRNDLMERKKYVKHTYSCVFIGYGLDVSVENYADCLSKEPEEERKVLVFSSPMELEIGDLVVTYTMPTADNGGVFALAVVVNPDNYGLDNKALQQYKDSNTTGYIIAKVGVISNIIKEMKLRKMEKLHYKLTVTLDDLEVVDDREKSKQKKAQSKEIYNDSDDIDYGYEYIFR